ncbi:MAG: hypothetical protein IPM35_14070 [Myxococcales bacterium]|nr:hypothetical protein [Myxococcales bacterium]
MRTDRIAGVVLAHARAELFATATAIPGIRIAPKAALQVIDELFQGLEVVPGSDEVYRAAVARCAMVGVTSGMVEDAVEGSDDQDFDEVDLVELDGFLVARSKQPRDWRLEAFDHRTLREERIRKLSGQ